MANLFDITSKNILITALNKPTAVEKLYWAFSSPTYEILKRLDEGKIVYNAHNNPKFVEDVVRDMLSAVLNKYKDLPNDVIVIARSESEESIHKHNAFAERVTTLGELRN